MDDLTRQLSEQFGFAKFRPGQEEVIRAVLAGRDAMAVMPTGQGKSLCYQLPATLLPGLTLVISPLIALMQDQVEALTQAGVKAAFLNSTLDYREQTALESRVAAGGLALGAPYLPAAKFLRGDGLVTFEQTGHLVVAGVQGKPGVSEDAALL